MTPGRFRARFGAALLSTSILFAACGGGDAGNGGTGPVTVSPASIEAVATPAATAQAGSTMAIAPKVLVKGTNGQPLGGVSVSFTVSGGGSVSSTSATTSSSGEASPGSWTLGTQVGTNTIVASVQGLSPVTFLVTATAADPAAINLLSDNVATAGAGQVINPGVRVIDRFGNGVGNVTVAFSADAGTLAAPSSLTDASGVARAPGWTLPTTIGAPKLDATVGTLTTSIIVAVGAGAPAQMTKIAGDAQTGLAGAAAAVRPSVRVLDAFGNPVGNTQVTFTKGTGNGSATGATQTTDASGIATVGGWTLGTTAGANTLNATAGTALATFTATGTAGPLSQLAIVTGNSQTATVNNAVATRPAVRAADQFGNGVSGVTVTFAVATGGGSITGASATTAADGLATLGSWTLGTSAGANSLSVSATGVTAVTINATGVAAGAASMAKVSGDLQTAAAGTATATSPTVVVQDQFGNPVNGANVTFAVTAGGGVVTGASRTTDSNGRAAPTQWLLGAAGTNSLSATVNGAGSVTFTATATGSAPLVLTKVAGDNSVCAVNTTACTFTAKVTNTLGAAIAGETVTWSSGGQTLNTVSSATGTVTATNLVAQSAPGNFTQTATLQSTGASVTFSYQTVTVQQGNFNIDVRFATPPTPGQQAAFNGAASRWQSIITGDLPNITILPSDGITANICGITHPAVAETIDDLVIFVELLTLDGPGGLLGQAGPCIYRQSSNLPIIGTMQFDVADLATMETNGTLRDVITHEMGHVLGIGSMWFVPPTSFLLTGAGGSDPFFTGVNAKDYFTRAGGVIAAGNGVPVENCLVGVPSSCGAGTRDSHWRESVFKTELMTGYIGSGSNPLSTVTIAALADQGYQVNYAAGDSYTLPGASGNMATDAETGAASLFELSQLTKLNERPSKPPMTLNHR